MCSSLALVLATVLVGSLLNDSSGSKSPDALMKIVKGHDASIESFPFLVKIYYGGSFICGGSSITPSCVITAAHCVHDMQLSRLEVRAGKTRLHEDSQRSKLDFSILPVEYDRSLLDFDVALLKLERPLDVESIEIDYNDVEENDVITIAGWGSTESYVTPSKVRLKAAQKQVTSWSMCRRAYSILLSKNMFCAHSATGADSCGGDSGGPAIRNGKQVGLVSWGYGCGLKNYPGVYVRLGSERISSFLRKAKRYC